MATVKKSVDDRLKNIYPLREFKPISRLFIKYGFTTQAELDESLRLANSLVNMRKVFAESKQRIQTRVNVRIDPAIHFAAIRNTMKLLFPSLVVPEVGSLSIDATVSSLTKSASSGYPLYKKKRDLIPDIRK